MTSPHWGWKTPDMLTDDSLLYDMKRDVKIDQRLCYCAEISAHGKMLTQWKHNRPVRKAMKLWSGCGLWRNGAVAPSAFLFCLYFHLQHNTSGLKPDCWSTCCQPELNLFSLPKSSSYAEKNVIRFSCINVMLLLPHFRKKNCIPENLHGVSEKSRRQSHRLFQYLNNLLSH